MESHVESPIFDIKLTRYGRCITRSVSIEIVEVPRQGDSTVSFGHSDLLYVQGLEPRDVHLRYTFGHVGEHPLEGASDAFVEVWIGALAWFPQPVRLPVEELDCLGVVEAAGGDCKEQE